MSNRKILWLIVVVVLAAGIYLLRIGFKKTGNSGIENGTISVVGTFYPLSHFAQIVGGDFVTVTNITPAGAEPHDYEPVPQDLVKAYSSKVFIMNGAGVDTWAEKIQPELKSKNIIVVKMSDKLDLIADPSGAETDPHVWLDPVRAQIEVELTRDALIQADPGHRDAYENNSAQYIFQLQELDKEFRDGLASCQMHDIVTSHAAFGYLAKRYGLNQTSISGLSPDAEPSAQKLAEIAKLVKDKGIKYIFYETLVSPKLSETIANETGAKTIAFNPLEGLTDQEIKDGKTYISVMKDNLAALRTALDCK